MRLLKIYRNVKKIVSNKSELIVFSGQPPTNFRVEFMDGKTTPLHSRGMNPFKRLNLLTLKVKW
jgi:hypothetical protein